MIIPIFSTICSILPHQMRCLPAGSGCFNALAVRP